MISSSDAETYQRHLQNLVSQTLSGNNTTSVRGTGKTNGEIVEELILSFRSTRNEDYGSSVR